MQYDIQSNSVAWLCFVNGHDFLLLRGTRTERPLL
jgi:hypothetical protein